jgi:hypothetical protein
MRRRTFEAFHAFKDGGSARFFVFQNGRKMADTGCAFVHKVHGVRSVFDVRVLGIIANFGAD